MTYSITSTPPARDFLGSIDPDLMHHITSYISAEDKNRVAETCRKICNWSYQCQLQFLTQYPQMATFIPDFYQSADCRELYQSCYRLASNAAAIVTRRQTRKYNFREVRLEQWIYHRMIEACVAGREREKSTNQTPSIKSLLEKTTYQSLLLAAIAINEPRLRKVQLNLKILNADFDIDLLALIQLSAAKIKTPQEEERFNKDLLDLLDQGLLFRSPSFFNQSPQTPEAASKRNQWLRAERRELLTSLLKKAGEQKLWSTFEQLVKVEVRKGPFLHSWDAIADLCFRASEHSQFIRDLLSSAYAPLDGTWIPENGYEVQGSEKPCLHTTIMYAADKNDRELLQIILDTIHPSLLDVRILKSVRDLFQPHLLREQDPPQDHNLKNSSLSIRRANHPSDAWSAQNLIEWFNQEIARRYPEEIVREALENACARRYPEMAEAILARIIHLYPETSQARWREIAAPYLERIAQDSRARISGEAPEEI